LTCGGEGQPCCPQGQTCTGDLACQSNHTCGGTACNTTGAACCVGPIDPLDPFFGTAVNCTGIASNGSPLTCDITPGASAGTCIPSCGTFGEIPCQGGQCDPGLTVQPDGTCNQTQGIVNPPENLTSWVSVNVTGPITLQGIAPWTGCSQPPGGGHPQPVWPPCPSEFTTGSPTAPAWVLGTAPNEGFEISDGAPPNVTKLYTPTSDVNLQLDVSFTDDSAAVAVNISTVSVFSATCSHSFVPGLLEGNHAHYSVIIQQWMDNYLNAPTDPCPQSHAQLIGPTGIADNGTVAYNLPNPDSNPDQQSPRPARP
jgi:hypothetical protein